MKTPNQKFGLLAQLACARRELQMRERVYPRRVLEGRMPPDMAQRETECMLDIVNTLTCLVEEERLKQQPTFLDRIAPKE
jgi:hypothetical protein